jgi:hypothetical protein
VSDISLGPGIGVVVFSILTFLIGLALLLFTALAALLTAARGERRLPRVARFSVGPLTCLVLGVAFFLLQAADRDELARLDDWSFAFPIIGVAAAASAAVALATARRVRRSTRERVVAVKGAAAGGLASLAAALLGYAIFADDALVLRRSHLCLWLPLISAMAIFLVGAVAAVRRPDGADGGPPR